MKQIARYKVNFESKWIISSAALMGVALFCQMLFFFALNSPQEASGGELVLFLIIPAMLELAWIILLHSVKLNAAGVYGILGVVFCLLLAVQVCLTGGVVYLVLAIIGYLLASGLLLMITGGFLPYKYFGFAAFALLGLIRFFSSGIFGLLRRQQWAGLAQALPGVCILVAIMAFFGGITGVKIKK